MYPIKFDNLYYKKIWGGRDLKKFRSNLPKGNIGESWDIACHKNGIGIVKNGEYKGVRFNDLISVLGKSLVGDKVSEKRFPLLVKIINSKEKLSVQVHPGDEYAMRNENEYGKTECWYVIDAKEGASIIVGTKNCYTRGMFEDAAKSGKLSKYLNRVNVKKGDFFLINSGLVHAIGEGVILAEIQQNSDITYRVYDYDRGRKTNLKKALDVIDFNLTCENLNKDREVEYDNKKITLCHNKYFDVEKINVNTSFKDISERERFSILTCVDGSGVIKSDGGYKEEIKVGDSYLIPAYLGEYRVEGKATLLKSYPNR
ncbi:type I phosphomannose isomerase catalytic subunit [Clostridium sp. BJN0001]|uniref:type I phosphomannose isomerase catalytic subunit n=1 Tax=Clostridium sp. BJN0001 TaxID=2930219 RepID=UPI001FD4E902|nr:type I phosphomannose isomerase catalytic subunit [Clostridium sp. BJN0001]